MTPFLRLAGHMCDARLWHGRDWGGPPLDADLGRDDSIAGMARTALAAAPERFVAVGFSMGGIVALEIARVAPERLAGLVLLDTNPGADTPARRDLRARQQAAVRAGRLEEVVRDELKPNYLAAANRARADLLALTMAMAMDLGPDVFLRQSEALKTRTDNWAALRAFPAPVLVVCGAEDALCPPALHEEIAAAAPCAELHVVEGAGHLLPLEQPRALSARIAGWAARHRSGETHCPTAS